MKDEMAEAIRHGITVRREVLLGLSWEQRVRLLELLFVEFLGEQHATLQKWAALTGQSAQVDTGYIAQFVASIILQEPGQGFRGKGDDLADGSEVKAAANISGVDRPRWNHNMGTIANDGARRARGQLTMAEVYLAAPHVFYLLVDRRVNDQRLPKPIRVRGWLLDGQEDEAWRSLIKTFVGQRTSSQYNLQLHPPVGWDDDIVVNTLGNLDFESALVFCAEVVRDSEGDVTVEWPVPLSRDVPPAQGKSVALPYGGLHDRPSRLTAASDLVADIETLPRLFPGILSPDDETSIETEARREGRADEGES